MQPPLNSQTEGACWNVVLLCTFLPHPEGICACMLHHTPYYINPLPTSYTPQASSHLKSSKIFGSNNILRYACGQRGGGAYVRTYVRTNTTLTTHLHAGTCSRPMGSTLANQCSVQPWEPTAAHDTQVALFARGIRQQGLLTVTMHATHRHGATLSLPHYSTCTHSTVQI